jgi:hypothetical protein
MVTVLELRLAKGTLGLLTRVTAERVTVPAKPLRLVTVTVDVVL